MSGTGALKKPVSRVVTLTASSALACVFAFAALTGVQAQSNDALAGAIKVSPNAKLLLVADELVYNRDADTITAQGSVQIDYDGNKLVARQVTYDQKTGRLLATGNVQIVEKDGNQIFTDKIDITDDFKDGFVNALRVETTDDTRFAAESAERQGGNVTIFNQGVYTACEPCVEHPEKAPIWQIKSRKIIWNGTKKTIRFEAARFELFGMPIATLPAFEIADPSVKRKTGFLIPGIHYKSQLGYGLTVPFYVALAPNYDLLLSPTIYSKQGLLAEVDFRQKFDNGSYSLKLAGIHQMKTNEFAATSVDATHKNRGLIGSKGQFNINPRWTFGWDVLVQSDKNFGYTYGIDGYSDFYRKNEVYLTGLSGRNYLDMHAYKFNAQEATVGKALNEMQPWVGSLDYSWTAPQSVYGGEFNFDMNVRGTHRSLIDKLAAGTGAGNIRGVSGSTERLSAEAEWKRTFITQGGLSITPLLALRGDGDLLNTADLTRTAALRGMATAGMELRWPVLFSTTSATHIIEPIAQIYVRNNETHAGQLPNEDAQSFVFDASTLFERDKFSGWDRVEGGTRANFGLRYSGAFNNGWSAYALAGQSYQLGGRNSFASPDLLAVGAFSGLESKVSDYVAMAGVSNNNGLTVALRGRFDEKTFETRRGEAELSYAGDPFALGVRYAYIQAQPKYGFDVDRHEVTGNASVKFKTNWRAFGSLTYDIRNKYVSNNTIGFGYDDSCTSYSLTYAESRSLKTVAGVTSISKPVRSIGFFLSFRTLGDFGTNQGLAK